MNLELSGKVAIVTGASRGLGRAAALALAGEGVNVLAVGRDEGLLGELEGAAAGAPGAVEGLACDLVDLERASELPARAEALFGPLEILVNNAGIAPAGPFLEQDWEQWERVFRVNVTAPATLAKAAGAGMVERGRGKIINVASTAGLLGKASLVSYSASKGAVVQMTKALSSEWARHGVQVNAIAPGAFETDAQKLVLESPEILRRRVRKIPAGRIADPDELGSLVCWLASPCSDYVSGSIVVIDGGESAKL
jgi:2-deoxy-D-gluconate 3-dehydrogenase